MLEKLKSSEEVKDVKVFNFMEVLLNDKQLAKLITKEKTQEAKNGMVEYVLEMKEGYSILVKPSRCEVIFRRIDKHHIKPQNFLEVYPSMKQCSIYTRGCYLLKWKTNSKDEGMLNCLLENKHYNERNDMKHSFTKLPLTYGIKFIKKMMSLDNNIDIKSNKLVNKNEYLDSKKAIVLDELIEEEA